MKRKTSPLAEEPAKKKPQADYVLNPEIFAPETRQRIKEELRDAAPYTHLRIPLLCDDSKMRGIHDELVHNLTANLKESDLFKVYQTCDLANLGRNGVMVDLAAQMPGLIALRDAIYSDEFREWVQEITQCGELSDKVDCATNLHTQGCHLLVHDDVIGTRKVSYIIYLTNPDESWTESDGGHLELYGKTKDGDPALYPAKRILPTFNSMCMFTVQPGTSFHAVQEVFAEDKPRMSIQGWFHGPEGPQGKQLATVNQLLALVPKEEIERGYSDYDHEVSEATKPSELSDEEMLLLSKYVNDAYLKDKSAADVRAKFEEDSVVVLHDFLKADVAAAIKQACCRADMEGGSKRGTPDYDYHAGEGNGWSGVGPTHKQRFLQYDGEGATASFAAVEPAGALMKTIERELLSGPAFAKLLSCLTSMLPTSRRGVTRRFRPGIDYTVAHFGTMTFKPRLSLSLCFVDDDDDVPREGVKKEDLWSAADKRAMWHSGEIGGFECYVMADDEAAEASDVYKEDPDDEGPLVQTLAQSNTLSIVLQDEGVMRFIKYVGGAAPGSRWDIACDYKVKEDPDDADEAEQE